uniref:Uncharacterized protein n=1 Tax=Arundo donax TaxID=35708 RepID=A0A0A9HM64_ARUDO
MRLLYEVLSPVSMEALF